MLGNSVKNVESFIITHTADEGVAFVSDSVNDDHTFFRKGVEYTWGSEPTIVSAILKVYPSPGPGSRFANEKERMVQFMTDHLFACKTRYLAQAFEDKTFMGQYSRGDGRHGRDIAATFYNTSKEAPIGDPTFPVFAAQYQNYLLAHVRTGDPASSNQTPVWPKVTMGDTMSNVMDAGNGGFHLVDDNVATADACDFWMDVMAAVTKKGGYTPPGGEVSSSLLTA
jgi:carboxylesterase type B